MIISEVDRTMPSGRIGVVATQAKTSVSVEALLQIIDFIEEQSSN
jgi:hypothetical protein